MKHFDLDWGAFVAWLPAWMALSPAARATWLSVPPERGMAATRVGAGRDELLAAGLLAPSTAPRSRSLEAPAPVRPWLAALASMERQRVLAAATRAALGGYLIEHFTPWEAQRCLDGNPHSYLYPDPSRLVARAASPSRVEAFLALDGRAAATRWEKDHTGPAEPRFLGKAGVLEAAQALLRALAAHPGPVPLAGLAALVPGTGPAVLSDALAVVVRFVLALVAMGADDQPVARLWPAVARRLRAPAGPPAPVEAAETLETAWRLDDMTAVLVEAAAEPLRLRGQDGGIFARTERAIAERLTPLPAWVMEMRETRQELFEDDAASALPRPPGGAEAGGDGRAERVTLASGLLQGMKLLRVVERPGEGMRLEATPAGMRWLGLSEHGRLAAVLDAMRDPAQRNPASHYGAAPAPGFFPVRLPFDAKAAGLDLRSATERAFLALPASGEMVPAAAFFADQVRRANPLLAPGVAAAAGREMRRGVLPREQLDELWEEILRTFLLFRLAPFGGARVGRTEAGESCLGMTEVGRYLLGAAKGFEYARTVEGSVVVQPDFEVVFLAPAPRAEAEIARFAERKGSGVGATLRITRPAVLRAAEQGATAAQVLATLEAASATPLPGNVARQLRDWFAATRRVRIAPALLVECPDEETAARVLSVAGKTLEPVSPTLLRLPDAGPKARAALVKKLRAQGVFLDG